MHDNRGFQAGPVRRVVLHADDFGMNSSVTQGILRGFSHGLLTSTAVLANAPDCRQALSGWRNMQKSAPHGGLPSSLIRHRLGDGDIPFDLGIHLNLTQGRPLTQHRYPEQLLDREGRFPGIFKLFRTLAGAEAKYRSGLAAELKAQIELVQDSGVVPTHLNGHQYVELLPAVSAIIPGLLGRYGIPVVRVAHEQRLFRTTILRRFQIGGWFLAQVKRSFATRFRIDMQCRAVPHPASFFGTAHAGRIDLGLIRQFLAAVKTDGITEIGLHPGLAPQATPEGASADGWDDPLAQWRSAELALLTSLDLFNLLDTQCIRLGRLGELSRRAAA